MGFAKADPVTALLLVVLALGACASSGDSADRAITDHPPIEDTNWRRGRAARHPFLRDGVQIVSVAERHVVVAPSASAIEQDGDLYLIRTPAHALSLMRPRETDVDARNAFGLIRALNVRVAGTPLVFQRERQRRYGAATFLAEDAEAWGIPEFASPERHGDEWWLDRPVWLGSGADSGPYLLREVIRDDGSFRVEVLRRLPYRGTHHTPPVII